MLKKSYAVRPSNSYDNHYIIKINGYNVLVAATYRNTTSQTRTVIEFDSVNFTGYMKETQKDVTYFDSVNNYYDYALDVIVEFANNKISTINAKRQLKQVVKTKMEKLNLMQKVVVNKQELLSMLKQLDDDVELTIELN